MVSLTLEDCQFCQQLPSLGVLPSLKDLKISRLNGIVSIGADFYGSISCSFTSLETLEFSRMKELEKWECEAVNGAFPRLQHLCVIGCPKLKGHLPEQLIHLKNLEIWNCQKLVASVPMAPEIHQLTLIGCGKLQFNYHPTTLKRLMVRGDNMDALLQESIGHVISVNNSLESLVVECCLNMNFPMSDFNFLVELYITDACDSLTTFPLDHFPTLHRLSLYGCRNLNKVDYKGLCHLSSLKDLFMVNPSLESLSEEGLPKSISTLRIRNCPLIKQRCQEPDGEDWPKIAHITYLYVD